MSRPGTTIALVASLCAAAATALYTRDHGQRHFLGTQPYEDIYYLPPPAWLEVFSLGYREALADGIWLRALVYFSEELGQRGGADYLYHYADAMLRLDPDFRRVYSWAATSSLYRASGVTLEGARRAIDYLEQGARRFPDDGELAWELGGTYLYELVPLLEDESAIREAKLRGLEQLRVATVYGTGPPWLALSVATGFRRLGQMERQIAHLEEAYAQSSDPAVKAEIERQLAELRSTAYTEALRRTYQELETDRRREFPYMDPGLYLLVRPKIDNDRLLLDHFDPTRQGRFEQDGVAAP